MVWWEWEREWGRVQHEARGDREGLPSHRRTGGRIKASQAPSGLPATSDPVDRRSEAPPPAPIHTHAHTHRQTCERARAHPRSTAAAGARWSRCGMGCLAQGSTIALDLCSAWSAPRKPAVVVKGVGPPPPHPLRPPPIKPYPFTRGGGGFARRQLRPPPPPPANAAPFGPFLAASAPPLAAAPRPQSVQVVD